MWQLRDGTHPVLTDEGGAILDELTGRWTHLTPTAAAAVMLLLAGNTPAQAAVEYASRYRLTTDHARDDIRTVSNALTSAGLARKAPAPHRRCWWGWWR
ncbi:HPr-rel-A system PqqD family protein [Streptomyces qinzhouensis]|uniref:HPr-rel-A system PqqD family protein n=1 Tax=Streptomyces qinzhouensis TaxID=2599401 RepID=A0A5B8J923_9ACTN|nr:HPr-rel-A system PqqD family protein [Streptomyces qinzhouensis]QDY76884.1 HPr-rel-A system PqqD family protein [Streptomyces qinzhouensis]